GRDAGAPVPRTVGIERSKGTLPMKPSGWMALALVSLLPASANAYFPQGVGPAVNALIGSQAGNRFHSTHLAVHVTRLTVFPTVGVGYLGGYPFIPAFAGVVPWGGYSPLLGYPYLGAYNPYGVYGMSPWVLPPVVVAPVPNDIPAPT